MSAPQAGGHSVRVVVITLVGNGVIAGAKTFASVLTHSGSMLAEAIHSWSDCLNQVLLLVGMRRAARGPSERHPLGTGRASYFWSFLVALMLFFGGGVFSIVEGVEKVLHAEAVHHVGIGVGILGLSLAIEAGSLWGCLREIHRKRGTRGVWEFLRATKDAELVVCTGENVAAAVGLAFAMIAMLLAWQVDPRFDGVGSILVGGVLVYVAVFLARKVKSLLLGERADPEIEQAFAEAVAADPRIARVLHLITVQQGPGEVLLAAKVKLAEGVAAGEVVAVINELESRVRARAPEVRWSFIEPDASA